MIEVTVLGSLAKRFQAVQQASTMASLSKTLISSQFARRYCQTFSTGEERSENSPGDCF